MSLQKLFIPDKPQVILPAYIDAVVGDTLEVFYRGIINAINPYNYNIYIKTTSNKGKAYNRKWIYTPEVGDTDILFEVQVKGNRDSVYAEGSTTIRIANNNTPPASTKHLLMIGDSLTDGDPLWPEAMRRLVESGGDPAGDGLTNIVAIGTNGTAPYKHEGYPGWGISTFLGETSPFWNPSTSETDFQYYVSENGFGGLDYVYILLGWNNVVVGATSPSDYAGYIAEYKQFLDILHSDYPNAKVGVLGVQIPSIIGGFAANYDNTYNTYERVQASFAQMEAYREMCEEAPYSTFCEYIQMSAVFDTDYNMPYSDVAVNARNTGVTEIQGTNGVHPSASGSNQIADAIYRHFKNRFLPL